MNFGLKKRFEIQEDGTIVARAGVQTNCSGIAAVRIRITSTEDTGIVFSLSQKEFNNERLGDLVVSGKAIPEAYKTAVFKGAQDAYEESGLSKGVQFELIEALVHPIDARELRFMEVGKTAVNGWVEHRRCIR
jgi:hypothetical protein